MCVHVQVCACVKSKGTNENWCSLVFSGSNVGGLHLKQISRQKIIFLVLWGDWIKKKKTALTQSVFCDSWQTVWGSLSVCVYWVRWVKKDQSAVWFHWQRAARFPSMLGALRFFSALHLPPLLLKRQTHMHALAVAKKSALTVLSWAELGCFVAMQPDKQAALLWCVHLPDRSGPVKPSRPLQLVCACFCHVAVLHLAVTQLQSHLAFTGKVLKDWWAAKVWHGLAGTGNC